MAASAFFTKVVETVYPQPQNGERNVIYGDAEGNPLTVIAGDGAFYIRGVRYNIVPRPDGYIGGGAFGVVWRAKKDPDTPKFTENSAAAQTYESLVNRHYADWVYQLLNAEECCVKLVQIETLAMAHDYDREITLQSQAGRHVEGVLAVLGATPTPTMDGVGPVTIDPKWIEDDHNPGYLKPKQGLPGQPSAGTHWAVIAVELAEKGNLRKWTNPLSSAGMGTFSVIEREKKLLMEDTTIEMTDMELENNAKDRAAICFQDQESVFGGIGNNGNKDGTNEDLARGVMFRLLTHVQELHAQNILHLDIKPDNLAINREWNVCLIDFGLAQRMNDPALGTCPKGTPGFIAPDANDSPDEKIDVFAMGMTMCCLLLSCENVFGDRERGPSYYERHLATMDGRGLKAWARQLQGWYADPTDAYHPYRPRIPPECISDAGADLCHRMVLRNKALRPSIADCLKHRWFQEGNLFGTNGAEWQHLVRESLKKTGGEGMQFWLRNSPGTDTYDTLAAEISHHHTRAGDGTPPVRQGAEESDGAGSVSTSSITASAAAKKRGQ